MDLQEEIDQRAREIHTDRYSMSISEAVAMYAEEDLEIHPEFQRIFRWNIEQQSRLVESVFLGIPIPPIFVAQRVDGVWDVVDGVQRLSTIFRFMGVLKKGDGSVDPAEPLVSGDYLNGLEGVVWEAGTPTEIDTNPIANLDDAQRRVFKRARLDFHIVQKESDDRAKFDLFQRLNSGTRLSEQEARNCLAVMLDQTFSEWLYARADYEAYDLTMDISERKEQEAYGVESVLRFLSCTKASRVELNAMGDVGEFLTKKMRDFITSTDFDRQLEKRRFEFVFTSLSTALGANAFKRPDRTGKFGGRFSISAFEAIATGIALHYDYWSGIADVESRSALLIEAIRKVWADPTFEQRAGGGKPANRRIPFMVEVGNRIFAE